MLNELDPRTYASATKKSWERYGNQKDRNKKKKEYDRAHKFAHAGRNAWNKEYADNGVTMTGFFPFGYKEKPNNYDDIDFGLHYAEDIEDGRFGKRYHYSDSGEDKWGDMYGDEEPDDYYFTTKYANVPLGYQEEWAEPRYDGDAWYMDGPFHYDQNGRDFNEMDDYTDPEDVKKTIRSKVSPKGISVAKQMAQNKGKYIKGKGWQ